MEEEKSKIEEEDEDPFGLEKSASPFKKKKTKTIKDSLFKSSGKKT